MQTINLDELKLKLDQIEIRASEDCKTNLNLKLLEFNKSFILSLCVYVGGFG